MRCEATVHDVKYQVPDDVKTNENFNLDSRVIMVRFPKKETG